MKAKIEPSIDDKLLWLTIFGDDGKEFLQMSIEQGAEFTHLSCYRRAGNSRNWISLRPVLIGPNPSPDTVCLEIEGILDEEIP